MIEHVFEVTPVEVVAKTPGHCDACQRPVDHIQNGHTFHVSAVERIAYAEGSTKGRPLTKHEVVVVVYGAHVCRPCARGALKAVAESPES